jgi:hypothetical protein
MRLLRGILLLACWLAFCTPEVWSQAGSAEHKLKAGEPVAGGGTSVSANFSLKGTVPLSPRDYSTSANYQLRAGVTSISTTLAGTYTYVGNVEMIVPLANRTLKIASDLGTVGLAGVFHYRFGGSQSYTSQDMAVGPGDTLRYDLSSALLGLRVLEYYFEITRGTQTVFVGSPNSPYRFVTNMTNAQALCPTPLPDARYRIVGIPVEIPGSRTVQAVFADDLGAYDVRQWRLGRYNSVLDSIIEFPNADIVAPGLGYWLIARGGKRFGAAGYSMRPNRSIDIGPYAGDYYEVPMDSGWNQLVNPFPFPVDWSQVIMDNDGAVGARDNAVVTDTLYYYNGASYETVFTFPTWNGVFVLIKKRDVSLLFPWIESGSSASQREFRTVASATPQWYIELGLESNGRYDNGNFIGVFADASVGLDNYDYYEPPPAPGASRMALRLPSGSSSLHRCDYRPPFKDGATWDVDFSSGANRKLSVTKMMQVPEDMEAWLILDIGETHRLEEGSVISLPADVKEAQLIVGTPGYASGEVADALPDEYELSQCFPNPFNPQTTIRYALPFPGYVTLQIYNVLGQQVTTLVNGPVEAGHHSVVWNGTDDHGRVVASGLYFYRLETDGFQETRKMLLLK